MATEVTWLGHGSWSLRIGECDVLVDPFLKENPSATMNPTDVNADFILVSHGHFDHVADVAPIAKRTGATIVSNFEICQWFAEKHQLTNSFGMNLGGGTLLPFGRVTLTVAHHSSQLPDGSYGGNPGGFLLELPEGNLYFACDTALFSDMELIGNRGIKLAVLPIGDVFTMGIVDAVEAVKLIRPERVVPAHFDTWPPIKQDSNLWAQKVREETSADPFLPKVGIPFSL